MQEEGQEHIDDIMDWSRDELLSKSGSRNHNMLSECGAADLLVQAQREDSGCIDEYPRGGMIRTSDAPAPNSPPSRQSRITEENSQTSSVAPEQQNQQTLLQKSKKQQSIRIKQ